MGVGGPKWTKPELSSFAAAKSSVGQKPHYEIDGNTKDHPELSSQGVAELLGHHGAGEIPGSIRHTLEI